jgi:methylmalonyl-CoA carboxyltransferase large subunit
MAETTAVDPAILIEELRAEIKALSERLAMLEAHYSSEPKLSHRAGPAPAAPPPTRPEPISEEILLVISAAVAAFLGERAHVKQVRLLRSPAWAQQGRVSIQASHHLQHRD